MTPSTKLRPFGIAGSITHDAIAPPVTFGCNVVMVVPRVKTKSLGTYSISGTGSLIVMLIDVEAGPPLLLAQTVYCVVVLFTVGEPEMVPFSKIKPFGNAGSISHVSGIPPETVGSQATLYSPRVRV